MQRSFLLFSNAIHEKTTLDHYVWGLNEFIKFYKLKDYDSLGGMDTKMLQVNDKVQNLNNLIQLFKNSKPLQILNELSDITWPIIRDAIFLYNANFEKSENFAKKELKVIIPKSRIDKYKNSLQTLSEVMCTNIPITDN